MVNTVYEFIPYLWQRGKHLIFDFFDKSALTFTTTKRVSNYRVRVGEMELLLEHKGISLGKPFFKIFCLRRSE